MVSFSRGEKDGMLVGVVRWNTAPSEIKSLEGAIEVEVMFPVTVIP